MNEINRNISSEPLPDAQAIKLLEEANRNYRTLLATKDGEIRVLRNKVFEAEKLVKEYRDIFQLMKDIRHDSLHHDC